jgi:DNA-directed RNA polymerase specialized sigma24 family protein
MTTNPDRMAAVQQRALKLNEMAVQLLGFIAVRELPQTQQIEVLNRVGFTPKEIAEILGTTANTVRVALFSIRKAKKQGRRTNMRRQEHKDEQD